MGFTEPVQFTRKEGWTSPVFRGASDEEIEVIFAYSNEDLGSDAELIGYSIRDRGGVLKAVEFITEVDDGSA